MTSAVAAPLLAPPTQTASGRLIQRCGDRTCPPGTCDHDGIAPRTTLRIDHERVQRATCAGGCDNVVDDDEPILSRSAILGHDVLDLPIWPKRLQPSLDVTSPDDPSEVEAERLATVVTQPDQPPAPASGSVEPGRLGSQALRPTVDARIEQPGEPSEDDSELVVTARVNRAADRTPKDVSANGLESTSGASRQIGDETRTYFERRFGHDFSAVQIHTGPAADVAARSLAARAFTFGNHIVFRDGEFSETSTQGRRLLAHELTHTIQQRVAPRLDGRTEPSSRAEHRLQRLGDLTKRPADVRCPVPGGSPGSAGTSVMFATNSAALDATAVTLLQSVAAAFHRGGGATTLRVDAFASVSGTDPLNWRLSCDRAEAVAGELMAPTDGSPGVPAGNVSTFAHGETVEFSSTNLIANQRAVITTSGGAPAPGPACPLGIAGPTTVDHFCAAYVPSDAAACGVFPAPNITLTATGASPGAVLRWSIIRGGARAAIVGPSAGPSIAVQGTAASLAADDVTVQMTDGTCTFTRPLTVRQPSSMTATQVPTTTPTFVQDLITYTVRDQFGAAMGAGICVDETVTVCSSTVGAIRFGDGATNAAGQVNDNLSVANAAGLPAALCVKLDQTLTAGGCGPLLHNMILMRPTGITLNIGSSCAAGDPCP